MEEIIRVVRVYEFTGPRSQVEEQVEHSLADGTHRRPKAIAGNRGMRDLVIRVATLGKFPEIVHEGVGVSVKSVIEGT